MTSWGTFRGAPETWVPRRYTGQTRYSAPLFGTLVLAAIECGSRPVLVISCVVAAMGILVPFVVP